MTLTRADRLTESVAKIRPPFALDPDLRFYSPQENRDAFDLPRVTRWLDYVTARWRPPAVPGAGTRVALLLPCTKYKPYPTSREHRAINRALLAAGWAPLGGSRAPRELAAVLEPGDDVALLHDGPLERGGVVLDRFVLSEPFALVPYDHAYYWGDEPSPATAYDDPGLFESRGTSVSPERSDCTAVRTASGRWTWGPAERDAYVDVHDRLVTAIGSALTRLAPDYRCILSWVSPGLTHRSFLVGRRRRREEGLPASRRGSSGPRPLTGVLDHHPGLLDVLPTGEQMEKARRALADRLALEGRPSGEGAVRAVFARGDGNDTPLGLPELLEHLVAALDDAGGGR